MTRYNYNGIIRLTSRIKNKLKRKAKPFFQIYLDQYLKKVSGVIHIGANNGQERFVYEKNDLPVLWIEPVTEYFLELKKNIKFFDKQIALQYLVTNKDDEKIKFYISNDEGGSSSIYKIKDLDKLWKGVKHEKSILMNSITLDSIFEREKIKNKYDALVLDTQGSELLVLEGAENLLSNVKYIKTEVADFDAYQNGCQHKHIDKFLSSHGFKQIRQFKFRSKEKVGSYYDILYKRDD